MSDAERHGTRGLEYSAWHRIASVVRYVSQQQARSLGMIDLDDVEYDVSTNRPVALIELAQDVGQSHKPAMVMENLARMAGIKAFIVLYALAEGANPANPKQQDIAGFRVKQVVPTRWSEWRKMTPQEYAQGLVCLRKSSP